MVKNKITITFKNKEKDFKLFLKEIEFLKPFYIEHLNENEIIINPSQLELINDDLEQLFDENENILSSIKNEYEFENETSTFYIDSQKNNWLLKKENNYESRII